MGTVTRGEWGRVDGDSTDRRLAASIARGLPPRGRGLALHADAPLPARRAAGARRRRAAGAGALRRRAGGERLARATGAARRTRRRARVLTEPRRGRRGGPLPARRSRRGLRRLPEPP